MRNMVCAVVRVKCLFIEKIKNKIFLFLKSKECRDRLFQERLHIEGS